MEIAETVKNVEGWMCKIIQTVSVVSYTAQAWPDASLPANSPQRPSHIILSQKSVRRHDGVIKAH